MPIHLLTGPANSGKASVLLGAVRAAAARGEEPLLVVPTIADQARYRRELAESGVALGARVERFDGLLRDVVARARIGAATVGALARERLIARATGSSPGLAASLAEAIADLESQRVTPRRLRGALRAWSASGERPAQLELFGSAGGAGPGGAGGDDLVGSAGERSTLELICDAYERYHEALATLRARDRELSSCAALDALRRRPSLWGATPVLVYGFDDLTALQLDAIETLGVAVGAAVTVSLAYEAGRLVFAGRAQTFQRLLPLAAEHTELPARADYYAAGSRAALHHLERSLLADGGGRAAPGEALRLIEGGDERAELRLVAGEVRALIDDGVAAEQIAIVHRSAGSVAGLMREALDAHGVPHALRTRIAFAETAIGRALLGAARCALGRGELADLLAWLRCPGVLEQPLLADRLEARALRTGAVSAARARALWEAERWPLRQLDRLAQAADESPPRFAEALLAELERLFAAPRRGRAAILSEHELDESAALAAARRALQELRELALRSGAGEASEALAVLERLSFAAGERPGPGRVLVVDPLGLRARRVRMLFVCGLQEGVFPAAPAPPLVSEGDRRALARASGLALAPAPEPLAAERYLLYALVSRPEDRLTLSWHASEQDGAPTARSLFVEDVCDAFEQTPVVRRASIDPDGAPGLDGSGAAARAIRPLGDERVLARLRERRLWSASSLELWAGCPVRWFVERLLGAEALGADPEPLARGSLAHAALKLTLERLRERTGSARLTAGSLAAARELLAQALGELQDEYPLSVAPERLPGARRRLRHELERYLRDAARREDPLEPTHLELQFGFEDDESSALGPLPLGDGVCVRGRIDRVDVDGDGLAVVYDYKGRSAPPAARWLREGSWQVALYMLAARELLGVRVVGGFYQPLAGRDLAARGALAGDAGVEIECVRTDRLDREDFERLLRECSLAARAAAEEARSGALEARPRTCAFGGGCAHPTICRCER